MTTGSRAGVVESSTDGNAGENAVAAALGLGARLRRALVPSIGVITLAVLPVYFSLHPYSARSVAALLLGVLGSALMFAGAALYAVRKRVKALKKIGKMRFWLDLHVLLCALGPILVMYHTGFRIKSPNAAIAFGAMAAVALSGVVGRYIYRHFQFSLSGERATLAEMRTEADGLNRTLDALRADSNDVIRVITEFFARRREATVGIFAAFRALVRLDRLERRLRRHLAQEWRPSRPSAPAASDRAWQDMVARRLGLEKKIAALEITTRLFALWHAVHVPLIWILLATFVVHVAAIALF